MNGRQVYGMGNEQDVIARLESDMEWYDHIFLVRGDDALSGRVAALLCHPEAAGNLQEKRLLLISPDVLCEVDGKGTPVRRISQLEDEMLCRLYNMYEFSDRFHILSREEQYGGLLNFVDSVILSTEEMLEALLH